MAQTFPDQQLLDAGRAYLAAACSGTATSAVEAMREALGQPSAPSGEPAPIDMVLHCPACGLQHIDAPEWVDDPHDIEQGRILGWKNEPHRSHLCHNPACGYIWRPADVPTNGVRAIKTKGKNDAPLAAQAAPAPQAEPVGYMSPKQISHIRDSEGSFGHYIPMRKTPAGNFTLALYTTRAPAVPAPGLPPGLRRAAELTREDLGPTGTNYPHVRELLAFAEQALRGQR